MDAYGNILKVRIKKWWLQKNNMYANCPNQLREGKKNENSWLLVTRETEKAYHLNETQMYIPQGGWLPKSCVLEVADL